MHSTQHSVNAIQVEESTDMADSALIKLRGGQEDTQMNYNNGGCQAGWEAEGMPLGAPSCLLNYMATAYLNPT